jgi:hypothetical protein
MTKGKISIRASLMPLKDITQDNVREMFGVFFKYYHNADMETFRRDLNSKDGAIIIRRNDNKAIAGFSTYRKLELEHKGRKVFAVFSGDTIVEREFWGNTALHFAAVRYVIREKIKFLRAPLYWFLISKGYKTYLIMANNVSNYFPRYDRKWDTDMKELLDMCCMMMFRDNYHPDEGVLRFGEGSQRLKCNVAEITGEMKRKYPKIAFFEKMNPTWRDGTELPCLGEITLSMIFGKAIKFSYKVVKKHILNLLGWRRRSSYGGMILEGKNKIVYEFPNLTW